MTSDRAYLPLVNPERSRSGGLSSIRRKIHRKRNSVGQVGYKLPPSIRNQESTQTSDIDDESSWEPSRKYKNPEEKAAVRRWVEKEASDILAAVTAPPRPGKPRKVKKTPKRLTRDALVASAYYERVARRERRAESERKTGRVYFVRCVATGRVKIGYSTDVTDRFRQLQTGSPSELELLAAVRTVRVEEKRLHRQFSHLRIRGEWFEPGDDLMALIAEHASPQGEQEGGDVNEAE
jgi:hypothetical protein